MWGDLVRIDYDENKIIARYVELVRALCKVGVITVEEMKKVTEWHLENLKSFVAEGKITGAEYSWAKAYANDHAM